ncbi:MarR family transcriptional regulator [Paenibacillus pabuli]|uniref:MarR family transcriptional regulator n=1 Tax=Paenibacillus pabuli TaxID=1472 RepID=A0ABX9BMV5_9BACL|nr:MarR family transcriptional regulator [Paenibacillus pabuli]RAI98352.1 MarR family transcriptional regulator [Paenibacillus pabuli]
MKKPSIGKMLSYIHRFNQKELASILKPFDIGGGGHHNYLKAILSNPGLNQDQLTNELKFDKATTTRCVKQLEEAGYVYRSVDSSDRRSYLLYPTQKAKDFEPVLKRILDEFSLQMTNCLSESDKQQFADLLKKIYDSKQG